MFVEETWDIFFLVAETSAFLLLFLTVIFSLEGAIQFLEIFSASVGILRGVSRGFDWVGVVLAGVVWGEGDGVVFMCWLGVDLMVLSCLLEELLEGDWFGGGLFVGGCFGLLGGLLDKFVDG